MRIDRLSLAAFGPFDGVELELSGGAHGLHIVYGPNEAGKSTLLRALGALLFGYQKSGEDWRHPYAKFRLAAVLRNVRDETLEFVRLKKNKDGLLDGAGGAVAETDVAKFLAGHERDAFESMFFLDGDRLEAGGKEIAAGKGKLGELLFAAAGTAPARRIAAELQSACGEIYAPRASVKTVPRLLKVAEDCRQRERQAVVPIERFVAEQAELARIETERAAFAEREASAKRELARRQKIAGVQRRLAAYRRAETEAQKFAEIPELPADLLDLAVRHDADLEHARTQFGVLQAKRKKLADEHAKSAASDPVLRWKKEIDAASEARAANRKAGVDRVKLADRIKSAEAAVAALAGAARIHGEDHERAAISESLAEKIRLLAARSVEMAARRAQLSADRMALEDERRVLAAKLAALPAPRDLAPLREPLDDWRAAEPAFAEHARLAVTIAHESTELQTAFSRTPYWRGSLDELLSARTPTAAEVATHRVALERSEANRQSADREVAERQQALAAIVAEMELLTGAKLNVTRADWTAARAERDAALQRHLDAKAAERKTLLAELQAAIATADRIAEELLAVERAAATHAGLERQRDRLSAAVAESEHRAAAVRSAAQASVESWKNVWDGLPVELRPPAEMAAWLEIRADLLTRSDRLQKQRTEAEVAAQRTATFRRDAMAAFQKAGEPIPSGAESWNEIVRRARRLLAAADAEDKRRDEIAGEVAELDARGAEIDKQIAREAREETAWRTAWDDALTRLGVASATSVDDVLEVVAAREAVAAQRREIVGWRQRMADIDADAAALAESYRRIAHGLDLSADAPADEIAETLARRLEAADEAAKRRMRLESELSEADREIEKTAKRISAAQAAYGSALQLAGAANLDDLRAACRSAQAKRDAKLDFAAQRDTLESVAAGEPLEPLLAAAEAEDATATAERLEAAERGLAEFDEERNRLAEAWADCKRRLQDTQRTDADAALARQDMQSTLAEATEAARRYAVLRGAAELLERAIRQYRERHEGPLLDRARALFRRLTGGSFADLAVDESDGQATLFAVRPDGARVDLDGLSEGSADQLYLALRLAGLERYFEAHESMPLVLDDLLLAFDDDRARHALGVLAELQARTQILFLTHHRHLVELAKTAVPADALFVHELG